MNAKTRLAIAALIFMMVQAVVYFAGLLLVLATPLAAEAMTLLPWVVALSIVVSAPASWFIAPRLRARYLHGRESRGDKIWAG